MMQILQKFNYVKKLKNLYRNLNLKFLMTKKIQIKEIILYQMKSLRKLVLKQSIPSIKA